MNADDAPHRLHWLRGFARAGGYTLLALVIYVLSIGPAFYLLLERSESMDRAVGTAYYPVIWLADSNGLQPWLAAYDTWWCYLPGGPNERFDRHHTP